MRTFAPAQPDASAIRRAYVRIGEIYGERGIDGVMEVSDGCRHAVAADPSQLDFCVAFASFARVLAARSGGELARAWAETAPAKELAVIRGALPPGADALARWAAVEVLTRQVVRPVQPPPARAASPPARARLQPADVKPHAKAHPPQTTTARASCGRRPTQLERTICANPDLKAEAARMSAAYDGALARGADPQRLDKDQAAWRARLRAAAPRPTDVAKLYRSRTRELAAERRKAWPYD